MPAVSDKDTVEILSVNADNVDDLGFFCQMSKRGTPGHNRKLAWLRARFAEGLRIRMLKLPARGFIEYIPGSYAWRAVEAAGYMVIHCLWVVGRSKGKGYASMLLKECLRDARQAGMEGVAIVTSKQPWLVGSKLLLRHGFEQVDQAPPAFELMVRRFGDAAPPRFCGGWERKAKQHKGRGFTILTTGQCPYNDDALGLFEEAARELDVPVKVIELKSSREVRERAPFAQGVFNVIYEGRPFAYHHLLKKDILKRLAQQEG